MFSTENGNNMVMPVAPAYGGGSFGSGFGGDFGAWIILFLIFGMFGNGFGGGFGGNNEFPWLWNGQNGINANTNAGFNQAATQSALSGIQSSITSGFGDTALGMAGINQSICQTGNGITAAVTGAQNALTQQMYSNQLADLERSYNAQTASTQGMNALQSQLANCCCENRQSIADVKYTIASEECATRANSTANTQAILDKLCALELDGYKRENDNLRQQLNMASLVASQNAQTAQIEAGQRALANEVEQYVNPTPKPSYIVQSPFCCNQGFQCGVA